MNTPNLSGYLNQFQIFIKIAENGNLSKAARELGLTPSTVSKSLSKLEDTIGASLIIRESRPFQLTIDGRRILQMAYRIVSEIESIVDSTRVVGQLGNVLRVSCSVAFGCTHIPWISSEFQELHPDVYINVDLNDQLINIEREEFDVALRITSDVASSGWNAEPLMDIHWFYCASSEYLGRHPPVSVPADLKFHHCLVYPQMTNDGRWKFYNHGKSETVQVINSKGNDNRRGVKEETLRVTPFLSCNSSLLLLQRALLHGGIACLPDYLASHYVNTGKLVRVLSEYTPGVTHRLQALMSPSAKDNKTVKRFISFLKVRIPQKMGFVE